MAPTDIRAAASLRPTDVGAAALATRLAFLAAGFSIACWAPLIPFAKTQTGVDDATLGLLLLCLGIGSIVAMPVTGLISARRGARSMILAGGFGLAVFLPVLALAPGPVALGAALFVFGAALGTIDVAMNVHAVEVEEMAARPLMSGFHAMWSVGGIAGAGVVTALLAAGMAPIAAAVLGGVLAGIAMLFAAPRLLRARGGEPVPFALPRGIVLLIAGLAAISFLVEGAVLDWGALLILDLQLTRSEQAGIGYILFSIAMTIGRLAGDRIVAAVGGTRVLLWGGLTTVLGIAAILVLPGTVAPLIGFLLIGAGASNIVPVLFSLAGRQKVMPQGLAIAAVTTTGYAGVLLGPAAVGFVSHLSSLPLAFWMLAALMAVVPATARIATRA